LIKKGKKRLFDLNKFLLTWFAKEQGKEPNYSLAKGRITLHGCTVEKDFGDFNFTIHTSADDVYTMTTKSLKDTVDWVEKLQTCIQFCAIGSAKTQAEQKGFLEIKGKRFFFVCSDNSLKCYLTENTSGKPIEQTKLYGCSVLESGKNTFIIASPDGKTVELSTKTEEDTRKWIDALQEAILRDNQLIENGLTMRGYMEKKGFATLVCSEKWGIDVVHSTTKHNGKRCSKQSSKCNQSCRFQCR